MRAGRIGARVHVLPVVDIVRRAQTYRSPELRGNPEVDLGTHVNRLRMALITFEVIHPEGRDDRATLVQLDSAPRRDELIDPCRRAAPAGAPIAVHIAEVPEGATDMHPPLVFELCVHVGISGSIGGQPTRRPELPPVEIPKRPLERPGRFLPVQRAPVVPSLLIGPEQNPQVVDLKPRRAPHVAGLEVDEAVLLGE